MPDGPLLPVRSAMALGLLHGPTELLPVSSSAHVTLVPWLARWPDARLADDRRKAFEVALHAGSAAALLAVAAARAGGGRVSPRRARRGLRRAALTTAPAAVAGAMFEGPIERRLGTPATIATGLLAGALALALADRAPEARGPDAVTPADELAVGLAQAAALMPGISRAGAALSAGRARGLSREAATRLNRDAALPVLLGATTLKAFRLARTGLEPGLRPAFAAGAAASGASTLAMAWAGTDTAAGLPLWSLAVYRAGLAAATIRRLRQNRRR